MGLLPSKQAMDAYTKIWETGGPIAMLDNIEERAKAGEYVPTLLPGQFLNKEGNLVKGKGKFHLAPPDQEQEEASQKPLSKNKRKKLQRESKDSLELLRESERVADRMLKRTLDKEDYKKAHQLLQETLEIAEPIEDMVSITEDYKELASLF